MKDLSKHSRTLTSAIEPLIGRMETMSIDEIKSEFISILKSDDIDIASTTSTKWILASNGVTGKRQMMHMIASIYLAGSGMKVI
jgi:hypothetical protein